MILPIPLISYMCLSSLLIMIKTDHYIRLVLKQLLRKSLKDIYMECIGAAVV